MKYYRINWNDYHFIVEQNSGEKERCIWSEINDGENKSICIGCDTCDCSKWSAFEKKWTRMVQPNMVKEITEAEAFIYML